MDFPGSNVPVFFFIIISIEVVFKGFSDTGGLGPDHIKKKIPVFNDGGFQVVSFPILVSPDKYFGGDIGFVDFFDQSCFDIGSVDGFTV